MEHTDSQLRLQRCLEAIISKLEETMAKSLSKTDPRRSTVNGAIDTNIYVFSIDASEEDLMLELKADIEEIVKQYLPQLSPPVENFLLDFLCRYSYCYEAREFINPFNVGILKTLVHDAEQILASLNAFQAAFDGPEDKVKEFLKKYPMMKDRCGPRGTTLLYTATRKNRINLVKYLVTQARCSVNAQNQQHIKRALSKPVAHHHDFKPIPSAGSTALHAACYDGHEEIVKFLFEHGADCFLRNHADETPLDNARHRPNIYKYFTEVLVLGYSRNKSELPYLPIREEDELYVVDCVWEYKPFQDQRWFAFSEGESKTFQDSLILKHNQEFKREIHLQTRHTTYAVSLIEFLRSGKEGDYSQQIAWIRCRGSSILNFSCYCLWQIMFTECPKASPEPSLTMLTIPTIYDSNFKVQLTSWYFCDANTSAQLDETMKYRRKYIRLFIPYVCPDELIFDLQSFSFTNDKRTVTGFLRWIPKMISNNSRNEKKIIGIDDFQTLANLDLIPLSTTRLREVLRKDDRMPIDDDNDLLDHDDEHGFDIETDREDDGEGKQRGIIAASTHLANGSWSEEDSTHEKLSAVTASRVNALEDLGSKGMNDFINEDAGRVRSAQLQRTAGRTVRSEDLDDKSSATTKAQQVELAKRIDQRAQDLKNAELQVSTLLNSGSNREKEVSQLFDYINNTIKVQNQEQEQHTKLKEKSAIIERVEYDYIQNEVIYRFLTPKHSIIVFHLRDLVKNTDPSFKIQLPIIMFDQKNNQYVVTVEGFPAHHQGFKDILQRIWSLMNIIESARDFYRRHSNRIIKQLMAKSLYTVKSKTPSWHRYVEAFSQLLEAKSVEYGKKFQIYLDEQADALVDPCVVGQLLTPWLNIRKATDEFIQKNPLLNEVESIKQTALEEFIRKNILIEQGKLQQKPSDQSIRVLQDFINKVKKEFKTQKIYQGYEQKHFALIPKLLQRLLLYYDCFKVQLPLYELSIDLLDKIEKNPVTAISTSTGSGKSTLLPALLIAEGYDKVFVTQPRRVPCQLICRRVNETMASDSRPSKNSLAGWAVSGNAGNPNAKILYLTDGLLKERLLCDENVITTHTKAHRSVIFFIDEVHERSINIDLCLALLARLLSDQPALSTKMKVIISSATLDPSVPDLFSRNLQVGLAKFEMPLMKTLYPVLKIARPNENALDIVQELCKKCNRDEQILCFVSSVAQVNQSCKLIQELSGGTIVAFPLIQSQQSIVQRHNIAHGRVFFSTTVAETSLTFPCLKYVVDTGMINVPVYIHSSKRTVLQEVRAAESTIKQRLGRLGRTQPGEYYSVYNFKVEDIPYPTPTQICQSDLTNIEFLLRKSFLKKGLNYMKQFLPNQPSQLAIDTAVQQLKDLSIMGKGSSEKLTKEGEELAKLPDFGSLSMSRAVLAALREHDCGRDLICLSAILGVLNTTAILKGLPQHLKSPDGDFMTLLKVMNEILLMRPSTSKKQFNLREVCEAKGLTEIQHIINQALHRYETLETIMNQSDDFRVQAQIQSNNWEQIAKSLLTGYSNNVFVSMKDLKDRNHWFVRYNVGNEVAKLDLQSTLTRPISSAPVSIVIARDILYSTARRRTAVISFVGEVKAQWLQYPVEREFQLTAEEENYLSLEHRFSDAQRKFSDQTQISLRDQKIKVKGSFGVVLNAELHLRQQMITELKFHLSYTSKTNDHANFTRNVQAIMKMTNIFDPMRWRWAAEHQVEITINSMTDIKTCEITVKGRDSDNKKVKAEFDTFISWLRNCAAIRRPNDYVSPRVLRPAMRKDCRDIEERIACVTDTKRTPIDLYKGVRGSKATRETRMEVVAWIAVCKFDCKLEGGFVRDWIVGHYTARPAGVTDPKKWIDKSKSMPSILAEVVPRDLDCHLPSHMYFDIEKFQDELHKYGISCNVIPQNWRYVLLFDEEEPTGPFIVELIEPHVALTHDRIDLDVNNLSVEKNYTHELGMRINLQQRTGDIDLEKIVSNIKNKRFKVLRPVDEHIRDRIKKMQARGWTQDGPVLSIVPDPHFKYYAILVPLSSTTTLYIDVLAKMKKIPSAEIISIEEIRNPYLEQTYEGMKKLIAKQCRHQNPNEQELFHGTKDDGIDGITEDGYDDRFFNKKGYYGRGAYFADYPQKSHDYTRPNKDTGNRVIFYNKVLLGKTITLTEIDDSLVSAPVGYHSVIGKHSSTPEYIVYRYGQALPYLKIVYKA